MFQYIVLGIIWNKNRILKLTPTCFIKKFPTFARGDKNYKQKDILIPILILTYFSIFQYMSEKIGGAKGTELDDDFIEMERVSLVKSIL